MSKIIAELTQSVYAAISDIFTDVTEAYRRFYEQDIIVKKIIQNNGNGSTKI